MFITNSRQSDGQIEIIAGLCFLEMFPKRLVAVDRESLAVSGISMVRSMCPIGHRQERESIRRFIISLAMEIDVEDPGEAGEGQVEHEARREDLLDRRILVAARV